MRPGAAREAQEQSARPERDDEEAGKPNAARHHSDRQQQQRKDQEWRIDVRVLERGADAVIGEENVGAGKHVEEADITGRGGDERGDDIGAAKDRQPHRIAVAEQAGEHDGASAR